MSSKVKITDHCQLRFWCPGCNESHTIRITPGSPHSWGYNNNPESPTFTPSVLVTGRKFTDKGDADYAAWYAAGFPKNEDGSSPEFETVDVRCHTFVTNGLIQFLDDCSHDLARQTVPLPDWPDDKEI